MLILSKPKSLSRKALIAFLAAIGIELVLIVIEGLIQNGTYGRAIAGEPGYFIMLTSWISNLRYLFSNLTLSSAILFVGLVFLETRSTLSIGFDKLDAATISVRGPDDENIVWVGQRYRSELEAKAVAEALTYKLQEKTPG